MTIKRILFFIFLSFLIVNCEDKGSLPEPLTVPDTGILMDENDFLPVKEIRISKALLYDKYTLADTYMYKKEERYLQWDRIHRILDSLEKAQLFEHNWGILVNYKNKNGIPPLPAKHVKNKYNTVYDTLGTPRGQAIPYYKKSNLEAPERYGRDGRLITILEDTAEYIRAREIFSSEEWLIPAKYVKNIEVESFKKTIFVDRTNQNIVTLEHTDTAWLARSMNPATTGANRPPYKKETPAGIFVIQNQTPRMVYLKDGTNEYGGFSPHASRFTVGAYIHGVPTDAPGTNTYEFSSTLGTIPRSHMCVRTPTSHAKFIYDWADVEQTLVCVID